MHRFVPIALALCVAALPPCLGADLARGSVTEILFDPPLAGQAGESCASALTVSVGAPLDPVALRESIQALFLTGRFADIRADAVPATGGVRLTFRTEPVLFVGTVRVTGVPRPPTQSQLVNSTKLRLGELLTDERLGEAARLLRGQLAEHGFREASVSTHVERDRAAQQASIELRVTLGRRARFGALLATGESNPLSAPQIREVAGWRRDAEYRRERLQRGITRLREHFQVLGHWRSEIHVETAEYRPFENQVTLVVRIDPGPRLLVRLEGADVGQRKLRRLLPVFARGTVDEDLLALGAGNLRDLFQSQGFFDAAVDYEVERSDAERVSIVYRVSRGRRQSLRAVEIRGNRFFDAATISERMQVRPGRYSRPLFDQDLEAIRALYASNGFRDAKVTGSRSGSVASVEIEEGAPTFVGGLVTSGFGEFSDAVGAFEFASAPGQPFSETSVASDRLRVIREFYNSGYQDVTFAWRAEPGSTPGEIVLHYNVGHGEPVRTGRTIVSGARRTREGVLGRRIELEEGVPLSQASLFATQRNLYDLGVFSKVDVALQNPVGDEPSKNVLVHVEEARRWAVGVGGGAEFARIGRNTAELTNPAGEATFSPRTTLEVTRLNVGGRAHTMTFRTRLSLLQQRGLFTYQAPRWFDSDRWRLTLSGLYDTFRNVNTFAGRRMEAAFQLSQQLDRTRTVLYRYAYRRTSVDSETLHIEPLLIPLVSQPVRVGAVSSTLIQDRRDDPTDTSRGTFNTVNISLASKVLGSQLGFARLLAQNSTYHRIRRRIVFARTIQLGVNLPWTGPAQGRAADGFAARPDTRIPLPERFFAGGANSHRGFAYNQAGPRDPATGFPLGGGSQFLNSFELRFPLPAADISGVLFHDAGNVYSRPGRISFRGSQRRRVSSTGAKEFDFDYMVHAMGLGIRYRTPIGPVRFDLAYSPNSPRFVGFDGTREQLLTGTGTFREQRIGALQFHFSLGQTF